MNHDVWHLARPVPKRYCLDIVSRNARLNLSRVRKNASGLSICLGNSGISRYAINIAKNDERDNKLSNISEKYGSNTCQYAHYAE